MKKLLSLILTLFLAIGLFPVTATAFAEKEYTEFNIVFEEKEGAKVNETVIKIYASVGEGKLIDRTNEFTMEGVEWFYYVPAPEKGKTADDYDYVDEEIHVYGMLAQDGDTFQHQRYSYFLRIARLYAQEEDYFYRNVKINGVDIDELNGLCFNAGYEFYIKTITNGHSSSNTEGSTGDNNGPSEGGNDIEENETGKHKCKVCGVCPIQPLGICLFIWIAIILIVAIVIVILVTRRKKDEEKEEKKN